MEIALVSGGKRYFISALVTGTPTTTAPMIKANRSHG